jgi:hypothetical protein
MNFSSVSLNSVLQIFKHVGFFLTVFFSNSRTLISSSKIRSNFMYTPTLLKIIHFYKYENLQEIKIENYENIEFYNKLKLINYL